jgi:hypothetical protein
MAEQLTADSRYRLLDGAVPTSPDAIPSEFVIHEEGRLRVVWAPCDHVNSAARIAIVGITPGWQQLEIAYASAQRSLAAGLSYADACERAKAEASFAGAMRKNLVRMLDEIGVARALELETTGNLFGAPCEDLHTTSALRYPVFLDGKNYNGHTPHALKNGYLRSMVETVLGPELEEIAPALVVPLGKAASECVRHAIHCTGAQVSLLDGFPHPSGANGHRARNFEEQKHALTRTVENWGLTAR